MEEILASIRRIISEDDAPGAEAPVDAISKGMSEPEPTMEEILASIRRIISEDDASVVEEALNVQAAPVLAETPARPQRETSPIKAYPSPQEVPPARLAAIEPEWVDGLLTVRRDRASADLPVDVVDSLFQVLRYELTAFADDLAVNNTDPRFLHYIRRLASRLPEATPDQVTVFELGHASSRLEAYAGAFAEETTSAFLVEQYRGLIELLRQVTAQFPAWRDFKRNAFADELSQSQVDAGFALAGELAAAMETNDARVLIDPALPEAIRELVPAAGQSPALTASGKDLQAADALASSGNALRSLVLASIEKANSAKEAVSRGATKGFEKISEDVVGFTANLVYVGTISGLVALFPHLAWIAPMALAASKLRKKE